MRNKRLLLAVCAIFIVACGQKGALLLPAKPVEKVDEIAPIPVIELPLASHSEQPKEPSQ